MKKTAIAIVLAAAFVTGTLSLAKENGNVQAVPCAPQAYNVWVDVSGSMMKENTNRSKDGKEAETKIATAKKIMKRIAEANAGEAPSGIYTVFPFTVQSQPKKMTSEEYSKLVDEKIPEDLETVGRLTWLGSRAKAQLENEKRVILITDGGFTTWKQDEKPDPKATFGAFKSKGGEVLVLSLADNKEENKRLREIFSEDDIIDLQEALNDKEKEKSLIDKVLARKCEEILEIKGINFAFNEARITSDSKVILDKALKVIKKEYPGRKFQILGWTDSIGSDAYNLKLSRERAEAVKHYFEESGISPVLMIVEGKGKSFKYTNDTAHGRWENRRIDIIFD